VKATRWWELPSLCSGPPTFAHHDIGNPTAVFPGNERPALRQTIEDVASWLFVKLGGLAWCDSLLSDLGKGSQGRIIHFDMNQSGNDRRLRVQYENALYHMSSRGVGRCHLFLDDEDWTAFFDRCEKWWSGLGGSSERKAPQREGLIGIKNSIVTLAAIVLASMSIFAAEPATERPNVILICADDLGIGLLGSYGQ
jgi:hypothetical protein